MKKNVAGQKIGAQVVSAADGSAFTGSVTVSVTGDAGVQATGSVGSGACTHEGNGYHTYAPAQAETNYDLIAWTFTGTGAIPVTVQVYTTFPQTGDAFVTATNVETDTQDIQSRLPAALTAGGNIKADALAISGDTVAADNLESATDGTGYNIGNGSVVAASVTAGVTVAIGGIAAGSFAASAIDAAALATDAGQEIADRIIARNIAGGSDAGRTVKHALAVLRNKVDIAAGTLTVYDTDDSTSLWTATITTAAGNPISTLDPA